MSDITTQALQYAIDGLSVRQQAAAGNLANASTPGYKAKEVDFESTLAQALTDGNMAQAGAPSVTTSTAPTDARGNNVDPSAELVTLQETTLRYQAMVNAINTKFSILRGAMGGNF